MAAVPSCPCPGARWSVPAPAAPPAQHCPPGPAGASSPSSTGLGTAQTHLGVRGGSPQGVGVLGTWESVGVSLTFVPWQLLLLHQHWSNSLPVECPLSWECCGRICPVQSSPGPGALPRPQNNLGPPCPSPGTWHVSMEGVSSGTAGVTAVAWGALDRVLCVVPAGRGEDKTGGRLWGSPDSTTRPTWC